jgi:hypothetical protein
LSVNTLHCTLVCMSFKINMYLEPLPCSFYSTVQTMVNLKCDVFRWSGRNTSNWFLYLKCYQCDIIFLIKLRTRWLKICILEHVLRNCLINLWYMTIQTHRQSLGIRHRTNKNTTSNQKGLWASSCIAVDMCWIKQNINHTPVSDVPR